MKKILLILVAFVVVLTGCNQKESENHKNKQQKKVNRQVILKMK